MVAYNFQGRFAPLVATGQKRQTIRPNRKLRHAKPGEAVQLYTGMRGIHCKLLALGTCQFSTPCRIEETGILLGGELVVSLDNFAEADGFANFREMKAWFAETHGLPFEGTLITWLPKRLSMPGEPPCSSPSTCQTEHPSMSTQTR